MIQGGLSYENGRIQITINTSGTPVKFPYDPKQIENQMIKSTYTTRMDASQVNASRMQDDEKLDDMKMTQSEFNKNENPMLNSVNKSMLTAKEDMLRSQDINLNITSGGTGNAISLKIPDKVGQSNKKPL